jgi:cholesterol oxidase
MADRPRPPTALSFKETIRGCLVVEAQTPMEPMPVIMRLTVEIEDTDRFVADPDHQASLVGHVECRPLGGRLTVERGTLCFLTGAGNRSSGQVRYEQHLRTGDGARLVLLGRKTVPPNRPLRLWAAMSTVHASVRREPVEASAEDATAVLAQGVLRIGLLDFLKQLASFRARGPTRVDEAVAILRYVGAFLRWLPLYRPGRDDLTR